MNLRDQVLALRTGDRVEVTWDCSGAEITYVGTVRETGERGVMLTRGYTPTKRIVLYEDDVIFYKYAQTYKPHGRVLAIKKLD